MNLNRYTKFLFDRIVALFGLMLLCPILITIALLILVLMPDGPVFFKQQRIGRNGKLFTLFKFRSMKVMHSGSSISIAGESRITNLGAILRKYKLDELPELWNVLIGDMSFVGPRPDVPEYINFLQGDAQRILLLRPGITGPASLKYRNEEELLADIGIALKDGQQIKTSEGIIIYSIKDYNDMIIFPDKIRLNLYYLDHYSFINDVKMIVCTVLGMKMKYCGEII